MYPYTVIPSLSQQIVRFLLLNSNFSPFSVSFHYYNINISPRKYFPRISFPSRWYERLVTKHVTDGNIFSRKKGAIARAAKETKPVPLSPEWFDCVEKRKIRADFPFLVFFQPAAGRRRSFAFPSISPPRRIVIYGTLIPPRKEQSSSLDAISPFTCTIRFRFVVLLFCCFVSTLYAIATNGSKSKMVLKSVLLELLKRRVWIYEIVCRFYSCISRLLLAES